MELIDDQTQGFKVGIFADGRWIEGFHIYKAYYGYTAVFKFIYTNEEDLKSYTLFLSFLFV